MLDEAESGAFIAFEDGDFLIREGSLECGDHSLRVNNPGEVDQWSNTLIRKLLFWESYSSQRNAGDGPAVFTKSMSLQQRHISVATGKASGCPYAEISGLVTFEVDLGRYSMKAGRFPDRHDFL